MTDAAASTGALSPSSKPHDASQAIPAEKTTTEPPSAAAPPDFRKLKHKVRVEDKDDEVDYDELVRGYQKARASDQRFQTAKQMMREVEAFKKDPFAALKSAGVDKAQIKQMAEQLLLEEIEWEALSPAEQRAIKAEHEAKSVKEELEKRTKAEKAKEREAAETQAVAEIDEEIGQALKAMGRRPTPRLVARITETLIADYERQLQALRAEHGEELPEDAYSRLQRMPADRAVKHVQREYVSDIAEYLASLPIDEVRKVLPKELLDGLRQADVAQVLAQDPAGSRKPKAEQPPRQSREKAKRMSSDEYFKKLEEKWRA